MACMHGVLLVNLGTPTSPHPNDVYRYLIEFLTDARVIDMPWWKRQLLVRGTIVPKRYRQSAEAYQAIWTKEGSPLLVYGNKVKEALQQALGEGFLVELAMRYQEPSLSKGIAKLMQERVDSLLILPLFPQYASATTGSIHQRVMELLRHYAIIPQVTFVNQFAEHPRMIEAISAIAKGHISQKYDHYLFSFHGLPEKQIREADKKGHCLQSKSCCETFSSCYSAQCHATMRAILKSLSIPSNRSSICFQSRLGKDPWLQPYASDVINSLAKKGAKKVLVFCPSFVCDCLETTYEFGVDYAREFAHSGGEKLDLVPGLNDHPLWIQALHELVLSYHRGIQGYSK